MKAGQHLLFNGVSMRCTCLDGCFINTLDGPSFSPDASDPETLILPSGMNLGGFPRHVSSPLLSRCRVFSVMFHMTSNMTNRNCFEIWTDLLVLWSFQSRLDPAELSPNCVSCSIHFLGFISLLLFLSFPLVLAIFSNVMRCYYFKFLLFPTGLLPDENWTVFSLRARPDHNQAGSLVSILYKFIILFS